MTWLRLALANLAASPLTSFVNVVLLGLGTSSIVLLLLISDQLANTLSRDARGIDLVLGAKGSPVQLVLSSVYHADVPTGNIARAETDHWAADARVAQAIPLSLGDSYQGFRIVGTTPDYAALYQGEIADGRYWHAPMEAVIGAAVARDARLAEGGSFAGAHGLVGGSQEHAEHPYRVVGELAPTGTVLDRLILTSLESVWNLHESHPDEHAHAEPGTEDDDHHEDGDDHHSHGAGHEEDLPHDQDHSEDHRSAEEDAGAKGRDITAMLLRYSSPLAATTLPRQINSESRLQAASPAFEVARLLSLVGIGLNGLRAFAGVLILTAAFSVFAALYGALKARRYDLAMLRCLGATRSEVLLSLLVEGALLTAAGGMLGFVFGHGAMALIAQCLEVSRGVSITAMVWLQSESWLVLGLLIIGLSSAALPAWQAYRVDVARTLAN